MITGNVCVREQGKEFGTEGEVCFWDVEEGDMEGAFGLVGSEIGVDD